MPLDFNSYRQYQTPIKPPDSPVEVATDVAHLQDIQALSQQRQELVQAKLQQSRESAQVQQIMSGPEDMDTKIQKLYTVNPKTAVDVQKSWDTTRKAQVDFNDTLNEHASRALALYDPKNPDSWGHTQAVVAAIYQMAGKPVPSQWQGPPPDQATVDKWRQTSQSVKDQNAALKKKYEKDTFNVPGQTAPVLGAFDPETGQRLMPGPDGQMAEAVGATPAEKPTKEIATKLGSFEDYVARTYGDNPTPAQILAARKAYGQADDRPRVSVSVAGGGAPVSTDLGTLARQAGMTVDGLKRQASIYHETRDITGFGMGGAAAKKAIINAESILYPDSNIAASGAQFKADQASLKNSQGVLDSIQAFHPAAIANLKQFDTLFAKIPDTGSPFFNAPVRSLDRKMFGADNVLAAQTAVAVATREIARITSNPKLTGQLSDHARQEVSDFLPQDATLKEARDVMAVLKADLDNVEKGQRDQLKKIQYRLSHPGQEMPEEKTQTGGAPEQKPIPGIPGGVAELRNGRWIRVK